MVDIADIMKKSRSDPKSVELECALLDFLELPHTEQIELLFVELARTQAYIRDMRDFMNDRLAR